ncbi:MAG TPA: IS200/IS605 family transposase [Terriglobales bacterium]|nr:IS200/IS605 family transposase [Terriglobales bacterium]
MSHNHVSNRLHCIFSTKQRARSIGKGLQPRLWSYLEGIAVRLRVKPFATGGIDDHVHLLIALPPALSLSIAMQKIKANSSRWMKEQGAKGFEWQEGFSAFSVSISHMEATVAYIRDQQKHHRRRTFEEELAQILKRHGMNELE